MTERPRDLVPDLPDALFAPLLDAAADVLHDLEHDRVPTALRPLIGFDRKGLHRGPARQQLQRTFETDPEFRDRVVEHFLGRDSVAAALDAWNATDAFKIVETAAERADLPLLAAALFAGRPSGWEFGLGVACSAYEHGRLRKAEADDAQALDTRLTTAVEAQRRAEAALESTRERVSVLEGELRDERRSRRDKEAKAERAVQSAQQQAEQAEQTIARLTEARAALEARVERESRRAMESDQELRGLRRDLAQVKRELASANAALEDSAVPGSAWRRGEVQALTDAATTAGELARRLSELTTRARRSLDTADREDPSVIADPMPPRPNRAPVNVPPGLRDDTPAAVQEMVRTPGVVVIVDGYNVSMQGWAEQSVTAQRDRLIALLGDLHQRSRVDVTVVFDGSDVVGVEPPRAAGVRVLFSEVGEEADTVIVREAAALPAAVPVLVVSSDRWVRDHAESAGARVVTAAQFLAARRG